MPRARDARTVSCLLFVHSESADLLAGETHLPRRVASLLSLALSAPRDKPLNL